MAKLSKRAKVIREKVDPNKAYSLEEAVALLSELSTVKFKESLDVAINLGVDPRKSDQVVRGATVMPNGTGKDVRVAVFTQGANADAAKEAGADIVGMDELAEQVKKGQMDFWSAWPDAEPESGHRNARRGNCGQERQSGSGAFPYRQKRHHPHYPG